MGLHPASCILGYFCLSGLHQRVEKDSEVKLRPVQLLIYWHIWFKITAKMRFYVTRAFQRTPPGSHITSDNTGILSWLSWEGEEGPSTYSERWPFHTFCPSSSGNTKENLVMTWLGFISFCFIPFHMVRSRQGLAMEGEFETEHTEIRSVRKPAPRWLGHQYPSEYSRQTNEKSCVTKLKPFRERIFLGREGYTVRSRPLWCYL